MKKRKIEIHLNKEDGSGLVLALMVLLVLSVLGASLGAVTIGSLQLSDANRDSNSAYYIAEAGVNMAYEDFKKEVEESYADPMNSSETLFFSNIQGVDTTYIEPDINGRNGFKTQFGNQPKAKVVTNGPTGDGKERNYTIQSTGEIAGKKRTVQKTVTITWVPTKADSNFPKVPKSALIVKGKIDFEGGTIDGNIHTDSNGEKKIVFGWGTSLTGKIYANFQSDKEKEALFSFPKNYNKEKIIENTEKNTEKIDWISIERDVESYRDKTTVLKNYYKKILKEQPLKSISLNRRENIDLSHNTYYEAEELKINGKYHILIGDKDKFIFTEELTTGGNTDIEVIGDGLLTIVVSDSAIINRTFKLEGENVKIVSLDEAEIVIKGDSKITAQIFAPESDVLIENSGKVTGDIVADDIDVIGDAEIIGDIFAEDINLKNSGKVTGNIIVEEVEIKNNGRVTGNIIAEEVDVENSGRVIGSIIAKTAKLEGNPTLTYKEFPFDIFDQDSDTSADIKIDPGPTLESD